MQSSPLGATCLPVRMVRLVILALSFMSMLSCSWSPPKFGADKDVLRHLTAEFRLAPGAADAALSYRDACGEPRSLPIGDTLQSTIAQRAGELFGQVYGPGMSGSASPDRVIEFDVGVKELLLFVTGSEAQGYPASVNLGAIIDAYDGAGTPLERAHVQAETEGEVRADGKNCDLYGLDRVVQRAVDNLAKDVRHHLLTSEHIRLGLASQSAVAPVPAARLPAATPQPDRGLAGTPQPSQSTIPAANPAILAFRAMVIDENRNQVLEGGERIVIEVEVVNSGSGPAADVQVILSGSPELIGQLPPSIRVGDINPGETKKAETSGRLGAVPDLSQAELVMSLASPSPGAQLPPRKRFLVAVRPMPKEELKVLSVDVDQVPLPVKGHSRSGGVAIAIGISRYQDPSVPPVRYARRDAEVVAKYFGTAVGVPRQRVKTITNEGARAADLLALFEGWLPKATRPRGEVFIFISGRAVVDPATGTLSLVPYDGSLATSRRLIPLPRLHRVLGRLPIRQAIVFLDLSVMPSVGSGTVSSREPSWDGVGPALQGGKLMQVYGTSTIQEALRYEEGRHGLMTYYLLKGLGGAADMDKRGVVTVKELCRYVQNQVAKVAKDRYGNQQKPQCVPTLNPKAKVWAFPVARVR